MRSIDKRAVLRRMAKVRAVVQAEIMGNRGEDRYARGLSMEGFAGGYLQALDDVDAALTHGRPSDHRGYWRKAGK